MVPIFAIDYLYNRCNACIGWNRKEFCSETHCILATLSARQLGKKCIRLSMTPPIRGIQAIRAKKVKAILIVLLNRCRDARSFSSRFS
jgi:hypothetical protein